MRINVIWITVILFAFYTLVYCSTTNREDEESDAFDVQIRGDIILGGLFPIHEDGSPEGRHCGAIKPDKGIQRMEAMLFALDEINRNGSLLPTIKLGAHILDTCNQDTHGLEQTLKFIKNSLSQENKEFYQCPNNFGVINNAPKPVSTVIGAASSQVSSMVANVLRLFQIPQISYSSTSPELSDKTRFEYFTRVVPPDTQQARAMADVVKKLQWTYVSAVFDEGSYGEQGFEAFQKYAKERDICIALPKKLKRDFKDEDYEELVQELKKQKGRGVVLFVNEDNVRKILKAVSQLNYGAHFAWVASDNWGNKRTAVQDHPSVAVGAITIQPKIKPNDENSLSTNHLQESYVPFVVDAVFLAAHALSRLLHDRCGMLPFNICLSSNHVKIEGPKLLQYIRNTSFIGMQDEEVSLNQHGDRMIRYKVYQFRRVIQENSNQPQYQYYDIGEWVSKQPTSGRLAITASKVRELIVNESSIRAGYSGGVIPESKCGTKCGKNFYKSSTHSPCCWDCIPCNDTSVMNETSCTQCPSYYKPNDYKNECVIIIPETLTWDSPFALVPACFSAVGIVATLFVVIVFIKHNKTPVIMASGRELCYIMLCGICLCYGMTFFLLNPPTPAICGVLRMGLGLCLCIIYAAILTKTSRLSRIFTSNVRSLQRPKFISPKAQVVICCLFVAVQMLGGAIWLIASPPSIQRILSNDLKTVTISCEVTAQPMLLSLIYIALLIILCTVYAFKTRKIPENFNETKHIGFTMYATCIIWLAFIPIYFGTNNNFRVQITSLCMCLSLSGTVALCCFFAPKLYIVLFQPDKNVRNHTSLSGFQKMQMSMVQQQMRFLSRPTSTAPVAGSATLTSQNPDTANTTSLISMKSADSANDIRSKSDDRSSSTNLPKSESRTVAKPVTIVPNVHVKEKLIPRSNDEKCSPSETTPFLNSLKNDTTSLNDTKSIKSRSDSPDSYTEPARSLKNKQQHPEWIIVDPRSEFESIISDISTQKGTFV